MLRRRQGTLERLQRGRMLAGALFGESDGAPRRRRPAAVTDPGGDGQRLGPGGQSELGAAERSQRLTAVP